MSSVTSGMCFIGSSPLLIFGFKPAIEIFVKLCAIVGAVFAETGVAAGFADGVVVNFFQAHFAIHLVLSFARRNAFLPEQIGHSAGASFRFFNWRSRQRSPGHVRDTFHSMPACVTTSISRAPIPHR